MGYQKYCCYNRTECCSEFKKEWKNKNHSYVFSIEDYENHFNWLYPWHSEKWSYCNKTRRKPSISKSPSASCVAILISLNAIKMDILISHRKYKYFPHAVKIMRFWLKSQQFPKNFCANDFLIFIEHFFENISRRQNYDFGSLTQRYRFPTVTENISIHQSLWRQLQELSVNGRWSKTNSFTRTPQEKSASHREGGRGNVPLCLIERSSPMIITGWKKSKIINKNRPSPVKPQTEARRRSILRLGKWFDVILSSRQSTLGERGAKFSKKQ